MKLLIVVVAFNRPNSLNRCLSSLAKIKNDNSIKIDLAISIDRYKTLDSYENNFECVSIAREYNWKNGKKSVIQHAENLGLRKHILSCGSLVENYDAILMLEDDIVISEHALNYVFDSYQFYKDDLKIAGFSLYNHKKNFLNNEPFHPILDGHDVFFLQIASSWGQFWTKEQWFNFYEWYLKANELEMVKSGLPMNIINWPKTSWLKFFIWYMYESDLYFVYPRCSLTTNFTDPGTHNNKSDTLYQVGLLFDNISNYRFVGLETSYAVYDVHFENLFIQKYIAQLLGCNLNELSVDFYSTKFKVTRYLVSTKKLNYKKMLSFDLSYKSYELNILNACDGSKLFVYDTSIKDKLYSPLRSLFVNSRLEYLEVNVTFKTYIKNLLNNFKDINK